VFLFSLFMMMALVINKTKKRTFLLRKDISDKLDMYKNKSEIVNEALKLYFQLHSNNDDYFEIEYFTDDESEFLENLKENKNLDKTIAKINF